MMCLAQALRRADDRRADRRKGAKKGAEALETSRAGPVLVRLAPARAFAHHRGLSRLETLTPNVHVSVRPTIA